MPTYEYACSSCGNLWEDIQKISEPALTTCPKCNQETARRQISGGSFILKGGGWYADLYASKKPPKKESDVGSDSKSVASAESKTEAKSEAKSEAKAETKSEAPKKIESAAPAASVASPKK